MFTPGHLEAVRQDSPFDDRSAGAAGSIWVCDELHHLAGVALPLRVVCRHLEKVREHKQWEVISFLSVSKGKCIKVIMFPDNKQWIDSEKGNEGIWETEWVHATKMTSDKYHIISLNLQIQFSKTVSTTQAVQWKKKKKKKKKRQWALVTFAFQSGTLYESLCETAEHSTSTYST